MRLALTLLVLSACSSPAPTLTPAPSPPTAPKEASGPQPASVIDRWIARAGDAAVMLVATDSGVVARTEGEVLATVIDGAVDEPEYDASANLVWFRRGSSLWVLDLRQAAPAPIELLADLPEGISVVVRGRSSYGEAGGVPMYLALAWNATPAIDVDILIDDLADDDEIAAARATRLTGRDWLVAELERRLDPVPEQREAARVSDFTDCEDEDECGFAAEFGKTGWRLVVAHHSCGDYCHWGCLLADAKSRVTRPEKAGAPVWVSADELDEVGPCGDFRFDRTELRFAHGDQLCIPGEGCKAMGGRVLGFLRPGPIVSLGG